MQTSVRSASGKSALPRPIRASSAHPAAIGRHFFRSFRFREAGQYFHFALEQVIVLEDDIVQPDLIVFF